MLPASPNLGQYLRRHLVEWCQFHYQKNLDGLCLFDPTAVRADFPHSDINVLLVLKHAPQLARERYDAAAEVLMKAVIPGRKVLCRIQTVEEMEILHEMRLPLLNIYLTHVEIL